MSDGVACVKSDGVGLREVGPRGHARSRMAWASASKHETGTEVMRMVRSINARRTNALLYWAWRALAPVPAPSSAVCVGG